MKAAKDEVLEVESVPVGDGNLLNPNGLAVGAKRFDLDASPQEEGELVPVNAPKPPRFVEELPKIGALEVDVEADDEEDVSVDEGGVDVVC